jgi:hypothetical protein
MPRIDNSDTRFCFPTVLAIANGMYSQAVSESNIERRRSILDRRKTGTTPANAVHLRHVPWLQGSFPSFLHRNEFRFFVDVVCPSTHPMLDPHLHANLRVSGQPTHTPTQQQKENHHA